MESLGGEFNCTPGGLGSETKDTSVRGWRDNVCKV